MQRKVKVICTLGPSSYQEDMIEQLILAGMDVARLNFSHGDHEFYRVLINRIRHVAASLNKPIAILQDLQGPKIRIGQVENDSIVLKDGDNIAITNEKIIGTKEKICSTYESIIDDVNINDPVLLDDGKIVLKCIA